MGCTPVPGCNIALGLIMSHHRTRWGSHAAPARPQGPQRACHPMTVKGRAPVDQSGTMLLCADRRSQWLLCLASRDVPCWGAVAGSTQRLVP